MASKIDRPGAFELSDVNLISYTSTKALDTHLQDLEDL